MAHAIHINGIQFNSKKAAENYVQQLLEHYQYGDTIKGDDLSFFLSLIENHENSATKIGVGVDQLQVRRSQKNSHNKMIYIIRADDSEIDISWRKCIKPPSQFESDQRCSPRPRLEPGG